MALIEQGRMTLAQFLKSHGYHTAVVGKWHLGLDWQLKDGGNDYAAFGVNPQEYPEPEHRSGRGGYFTEAPKYVLEGVDIDYTQPITFGPNEMGLTIPSLLPLAWINHHMSTSKMASRSAFPLTLAVTP